MTLSIDEQLYGKVLPELKFICKFLLCEEGKRRVISLLKNHARHNIGGDLHLRLASLQEYIIGNIGHTFGEWRK